MFNFIFIYMSVLYCVLHVQHSAKQEYTLFIIILLLLLFIQTVTFSVATT